MDISLRSAGPVDAWQPFQRTAVKNDRFCPSARRFHRRRPVRVYRRADRNASRLCNLEQSLLSKQTFGPGTGSTGLCGKELFPTPASPPLRSLPPGQKTSLSPTDSKHQSSANDQEQLPPDSSSIPEWSPEWPESPPAEPPLPEQKHPGSRPSPWQAFLTPIQDFLAGGSLLVKTGIIVLFVGVSFLVKYAAEHSLLPIELRLSGAALAGVVLLALGWRLRIQRAAYAHALQGGGIGILYLTTFAALRLYALIPPSFAFSVLVAVAAALRGSGGPSGLPLPGGARRFGRLPCSDTGINGHRQPCRLVQLLCSPEPRHCRNRLVRAWRILNLIGFAFTFIIGTSWGWKYYRPEFFATTEPFLILFFLIYTFIAVLFALRQPPNLKGYVDGTLVFGTPIVAFALQALLVEPYHFGLAWSALGLGLFYLPLAWLLFLKRPVFMRTLAEAFFAFGIIFATLAIPFALDGRWTSAAWALEGAALLWVGVRQHRQSARVFGMLLQFGAGMCISHGHLRNSRLPSGAQRAFPGHGTHSPHRDLFRLHPSSP